MKNLFLLLAFFSINISFSQQAWEQINDFLFETTIKTSFSSEDKGYILLYNNDNSTVEFYSYDPILDSYEQKVDFPVQSNTSFTSFAIGDDGYVILQDNSTEEADILLYKYDAAQNLWEEKTGALFDDFGFNFGLGTAFSINDKGYFTSNGGNPGGNFKEYDPITDIWSTKSDYPGPSEGRIIDFTIGDVGYLAFGFDDFDTYPILWSYNQNTENWTQLEDIPWQFGDNAKASFAIGDLGYIGMFPILGAPTFYRYIPVTDNWELIESCGYASNNCFSFSIGNYGYVGAGHHLDLEKQVWKLDPEFLNNDDFSKIELTFYPNPTNDILTINGLESDSLFEVYELSGKIVAKGEIINNQISISQLADGPYIFKISNGTNEVNKLIIKK